MSLNIKESKYITVFQVEEKEKYVQANLSTGKKNQDGTWKNMSWRARFVGKAKESASTLKDKDKIEIKNGLIENYYDKEKKALYVTVVVFEFEVMQKAEPQTDEYAFMPVDDNMDSLPF